MENINLEILENIIDSKNVNQLRKIFEEYNSVDLADIVSGLDIKKTLFIFKTVPSNLTAEVFTYLDNDYKEELIGFLTSKDIKNVVEDIMNKEA